MFKKLMAILIVALLMLSCVGTAVMADETVDTNVYVTEEVVIDSEDPEAVITSPNYSNKDGSYVGFEFKTNQAVEDNVPTSNQISIYLAKYDLNNYVYPVDNVVLTFTFRETGNGVVNVFKTPAWNIETINWNSFGGDTFDFTPDKSNANFIKKADGDGSSSENKTTSVDVTDAVNEILRDDNPDNTLYLAYGRTTRGWQDKDNGIYADADYAMRIKVAVSKLQITQSEPIYEVEPTPTASIKFCDRTLISEGVTSPIFNNSISAYYKSGQDNTTGIKNAYSDGYGEPYGVSRANYVKFDLRSVANLPIKKITLTYNSNLKNKSWSVYHYLVEDDNWRGGLKTGTETVELNWDAVFPKNAETGKVEPTKYAPNKDKYIYNDPALGTGGLLYDADNNTFGAEGPFDVTELVKGELLANGGDGVVSLAIMVKTCYATNGGITSSPGAVRIKFNDTAGPFLHIEYDDGGEVTSSNENISFKINDVEAATLSNGVFKAETTITNTMIDSTKATLLMCIYEGNKLKEIFVKPALVNHRYVSGGINDVSVSSGKEIEVTENTKVGVYLWKDLLFPIPVNSGKVITAQ